MAIIFGDRIKWKYKHFLNGKTFVWKEKRGKFLGKVNHHKQVVEQMAVVKFDDNKSQSVIKYSQLEKE